MIRDQSRLDHLLARTRAFVRDVAIPNEERVEAEDLVGPDLVEAIARAGSTLPTASGEAVIVHAGDNAAGPTLPTKDDDPNVVRVDLHTVD